MLTNLLALSPGFCKGSTVFKWRFLAAMLFIIMLNESPNKVKCHHLYTECFWWQIYYLPLEFRFNVHKGLLEELKSDSFDYFILSGAICSKTT